MRNCQRRSAAVPRLLIFILSHCSSAEGEGLIVRAVESAQARFVQNVPQQKDDPAIEHPCSDPSTEEVCLTQEAVEALSPMDPPEFSCGETEGRTEQKVNPGFLSGEFIPVIIYLPPCYDPYLQVYPVLNLLHGKPQEEFRWLQLEVDEIVDKGILEAAWALFIIVMPQQPEPLFTQTDGGRGSLEQEIMQGLIPFNLDRYAITGEGERWAIAGV